MKNINKDELVNSVKEQSDHIANLCLELNANDMINQKEYNERDLMNATLIFNHIVWNMAIANHLSNWCTEEQGGILIWELWKSLRQTIQIHTGLDMHDVANNLTIK